LDAGCFGPVLIEISLQEDGVGWMFPLPFAMLSSPNLHFVAVFEQYALGSDMPKGEWVHYSFVGNHWLRVSVRGRKCSHILNDDEMMMLMILMITIMMTMMMMLMSSSDWLLSLS
jgi:hypothetical protein